MAHTISSGAGIAQTREIIKQQATQLGKLRKEELLFAALFSARINYFRQLQLLSDAVADVETQDAAKDLAQTYKEEASQRQKIDSLESRGRYLKHLQKVQNESLDEEARRCCE